MSLDVHIEEVRKLKGQHDNLDIINKIIMDSSDGQNIELQNTSISIINLRNPIYLSYLVSILKRGYRCLSSMLSH